MEYFKVWLTNQLEGKEREKKDQNGKILPKEIEYTYYPKLSLT